MMTQNQMLWHQNIKCTLAVCHMLQTEYFMSLPHPKFICWNANPQCGGYLEVEPLGDTSFRGKESSGMGLVPFRKRSHSFLAPSAIRGHSKKMAICEWGSRSSMDCESPGTFILDFQASGAARNNHLWFKPPAVWYFCHSSLRRLQGASSLEKETHEKDPNPTCRLEHSDQPVLLQTMAKLTLAPNTISPFPNSQIMVQCWTVSLCPLWLRNSTVAPRHPPFLLLSCKQYFFDFELGCPHCAQHPACICNTCSLNSLLKRQHL